MDQSSGSEVLRTAFLFDALRACFAAAACKSLRSTAYLAFLFVGISCVSHSLLDMVTSGGKGVALFWPFEKTRVLSPFTPVAAAPMSAARFFYFPWLAGHEV